MSLLSRRLVNTSLPLLMEALIVPIANPAQLVSRRALSVARMVWGSTSICHRFENGRSGLSQRSITICVGEIQQKLRRSGSSKTVVAVSLPGMRASKTTAFAGRALFCRDDGLVAYALRR